MEEAKNLKKDEKRRRHLRRVIHVGKFCGKRASIDSSFEAILDQLCSCMCNVNMQISSYCKLKYGEFYEAGPLS